jgi:hypothetical protein
MASDSAISQVGDNPSVNPDLVQTFVVKKEPHPKNVWLRLGHEAPDTTDLFANLKEIHRIYSR